MKNKHFLNGIFTAIVVLVGIMLLASCQTEQKEEKKPVKKGEEVSDSETVIIRDFTFNPDTVTITKGGTVTWKNNDSVTHTVTGEDFDSGNIGTGKAFSRKFETPGTYNYKCGLHPSMTGKVVVK